MKRPAIRRVAWLMSGVLLATTPDPSVASGRVEPVHNSAGQPAATAGDFPTLTAIRWLSDGSIGGWMQQSGGLDSGAGGIHPEGSAVRYQFGLPEQPPDKRWREESILPIFHARWEQGDIRYSQIVLLSRMEPGDVMSDGLLPADAVILVQLSGLSLASEYTDATAAFRVEVEDETIDLPPNP